MADSQPTTPIEAGYDAVHAAEPNSPTLLRIWREHAMGEDFPEEFWHISFLTVKEADRIAADLSLGDGVALADLGCGAGGPALYFAASSGVQVTGVDLSGAAIEIANARAEKLGLANRARFQKGSFEDTGLETASADAAVSFDAIMYTPDKRAAFAEAARVLRPGGSFGFTAFELNPEGVAGQPVIGTDPTDDFRPSMEAAGLTVLTYEETPRWKEKLYGAYSAVRDQQDALREEMGPIAVMAFLSEVSAVLDRHMYRRRVYCLARLPR
jgi:ubiquinone/menaquinone biosynthesis C-methylase UbiE